MTGYEAHGPAHPTTGHSISPNERRTTLCPNQVHLGLPVTEDVDMRWLMIVQVNDDAQAIGTQHGDHAYK